MKKLGSSLALIVVMLLLVPMGSTLALYPSATVHDAFPSCLTYIFAHANIIHWAFNSWCVLMLHNVFTPHRCIASYVSAVLFGVVWSCIVTPDASAVLGFSAVLFWFWGYLIPFFWHKDRTTVAALSLYLLVGFFIPHVAGWFHLGLCVMGFLYYHAEGAFRRFVIFISDGDEK